MTLKGEVGPLKSLLTARDMRIAMQVSLGKLALDINGAVGSLDPLDGADLTLKVEHPDLGGMLKKLELPVIATGPMQIDTRMKDAGALTQLDFNAKLGDLEASVKGTLKTRSLVGSDLKFEATAADAARLASVFEVSGVPAAPLKVSGHTVYSRKQIKFDALTAAIADASVRADGTMQLTGDRKLALNFEWQPPAWRSSGNVAGDEGRGQRRFRTHQRPYRTERSASGPGRESVGRFVVAGRRRKHIEAQLSSPRLDLTPFFPQDKPAETTAAAPRLRRQSPRRRRRSSCSARRRCLSKR